jgi:GGDEF domain-containing protein
VLAEIVVNVGASVGAALSGPGEPVTTQLLLDADRTMYRAKRRAAARSIVDLRRESADGLERAIPQQPNARLRIE